MHPLPIVVWFKRDLRLADHAPLAWAATRARQLGGQVLPLFVDEPGAWRQADASARQFGFANECVLALGDQVLRDGGVLLRLTGEATDVLTALKAQLGAFELVSHEETGNAWSYKRDLAVADWCRTSKVTWQEFASNGVVRRLRSHHGGRNAWSKHWDRRMSQAPLDGMREVPWLTPPLACSTPPGAAHFGLDDDAPNRQRGGRAQAEQALFSFLSHRFEKYRYEMSSPLTAAHSCSRISPHLAWGTLSVREAAHATRARRSELLGIPEFARPSGALASLKSFESRLHWHCHFIQKLETEPQIELRNVNCGYDGVRNEAALTQDEQLRLQAWAHGHTGVPFIDACMRSLRDSGWINFRMRAMLISFASYHLWLHWRQTGLVLARYFTDYEPGIHWSQCQMQSGVTGINLIRIYNPVKQSRDQDPKGEFIRRWLPELAHLAPEQIHEPWLHGGVRGYPSPIVELGAAARFARERMFGVAGAEQVRQEAVTVYERHGSRNPQRPGVKKRAVKAAQEAPDSGQMSLF